MKSSKNPGVLEKPVHTVPGLWQLFKELENALRESVQKGGRIISWQEAAASLYT